jgi:hypothetical protein
MKRTFEHHFGSPVFSLCVSDNNVGVMNLLERNFEIYKYLFTRPKEIIYWPDFVMRRN